MSEKKEEKQLTSGLLALVGGLIILGLAIWLMVTIFDYDFILNRVISN